MKRNIQDYFHSNVRALYTKIQFLCYLLLAFVFLVLPPIRFSAQEIINNQGNDQQSKIQETNNSAEMANNAPAATEAKLVEQETRELTRIKQTLQFGTDAAVLEILTTLRTMGLDSFAPNVVTRMRDSTNEKVLIRGFTYLRDVTYSKALNFAISYVNDFQNYSSRAVQFAFFYIQDFVDILNEEMKKSLNNVLLRILQKDNPSLSLTALTLLPRYYSEKDEPYYGDAFFEDEPALNVDTPIKNVPSDITSIESRLLSKKLIGMYENIFTPAVQDEIISTLGKIRAYNALPFLLDLANNEVRISQSRRSALILALGSFELLGDIFSTVRLRRLEIFQNARSNPSQKIRKAFFEALQMHEDANGTSAMQDNTLVPQWLMEGIRDDAVSVRQVVLTRIEALFERFTTEEQALLFEAISFVVNYDASNVVRAQAVKVLSKFPQGKAHIIATVKNITTLNAVNSAYLAVVLEAYARQGGLKALSTMVEKNIEKSMQENIFFTDALALMQEVSSILAIKKLDGVSNMVSIMLQHPDTTIQKNMLIVIAKNKLTDFFKTVEQMSQDVALPVAIRLQARQTAEVLKYNQKP